MKIQKWGGYSSKFIKTLRENDINFIYHITKLSNLSSIFKLKSLYSRQKLIAKKIYFKPQTNDLSKNLFLYNQ
ncbi:hypothetical protein [Campylobacter gastrosuis]|uniref:DarT domain-containing protein n=1 Tax=Campylobacter gastrosuis TaxID=2974576 RepID=A0ABT7HTE9_9BACT|nr:hypothetical protein [Campylobacter gastrosuis]MDL0090005.1 hypothetical protein [Campylobacter gastrosuis]